MCVCVCVCVCVMGSGNIDNEKEKIKIGVEVKDVQSTLPMIEAMVKDANDGGEEEDEEEDVSRPFMPPNKGLRGVLLPPILPKRVGGPDMEESLSRSISVLV